jgi:hypothetical protein
LSNEGDSRSFDEKPWRIVTDPSDNCDVRRETSVAANVLLKGLCLYLHMPSGTSLDHWKIVLTHEAGHAVAVRAIFGVSADVFVKANETGLLHKSAAYRHNTDLARAWSEGEYAINSLIVFAAGAKAEEICLGITKSEGFANDLRQIKLIRQAWENKCNGKAWDGLPETVREAGLRALPQCEATMNQIVREIDSNFERTATLINKHRKILDIVAAEAYRNANRVGDENLRHGDLLLSASRIEEIWNNEGVV